MRAQVCDFVRLVSDGFPTQGPVYEFGSYLVPGQEEVANLRPLFEKHKVAYVGCDMCPGPGVDRVENLHSLSIETASVGTAAIFAARRRRDGPTPAPAALRGRAPRRCPAAGGDRHRRDREGGA